MFKSLKCALFILFGLSLLALPSFVIAQGMWGPWAQLQTNKNHIGYYAGGGVLVSLDNTIQFREVWDQVDFPTTPEPPAQALAGQASPPVVDSDGFVYQLLNDDTSNARLRRLGTVMDSSCKVFSELIYAEVVIPLNGQTFNNISPILDEANQLIYFVSNQGFVFAYTMGLAPVWGPVQVGSEIRCSATLDPRFNRLYIVSNDDVDGDSVIEGQLTCLNGITGGLVFNWSPQDPLSFDPYYESYFSSPVAISSVTNGMTPPIEHVYVLGLADQDSNGSYSTVLYAVSENAANPGAAIMDWMYEIEPDTIPSIGAATYQYCAVTIIPDVLVGAALYADIYVGTRSGRVHLVQDRVFLPAVNVIPYNTGEEITGSFAMDNMRLYVATDQSIFLLDPSDLSLVVEYTTRGANVLTSPAVDRNGVLYYASGTRLRAIFYNPLAGSFSTWSYQPLVPDPLVSGTISSPVIGFLVDESGGAPPGDPNPPASEPSFAVYVVESNSSTIFALEENAPPEGGETAGVAGLNGLAYGNRLNNNMGKPATVFTFAATSMTADGLALDPDCDDITDVTLNINYRKEYLANSMCFYIGMPNNPGNSNRSATHAMTLNVGNNLYEYVTNASELDGGQFTYYVEYTDEFNATFSTEDTEGPVNGPNICPELDEIIDSPQTLTSNGMECRAEYEGNLTELTLRILYFDIDREPPAVKDAYILGDPYDMTYVRSSNNHQQFCDFYTINTIVPSADPFFYFRFEDNTLANSTMPCTLQYPEVGVFYPLKLSEPSVSPDVGDPSEVYTFTVRFFSPFNMAPDEAKVLINDDAIGNNMTLIPGTGSPGDGVYQYVTSPGELSTGLNNYAFYFSNNRDLDPNDLNEFIARSPMGSNMYTGPAISPWPVYRHDRMHSGKASSATSIIPDIPDFDFFQTGDAIPGSAVVDWNGKIYFGSRDKKFYCLNQDMTLNWSYNVGNWIDSSPTLGPDGTVIFPSRDNNIYCLRATDLPGGNTEANGNNRLLWRYSAQGISSSAPVIAPNGNVIVGSSYGYLYALKKNGTVNWIYPTGKAAIDGSPVVSSNGTIFFGATDSYIYALLPNGNLKWKFKAGDVIGSTPLLIENAGAVQQIIFTSNDKKVYSVANDGTLTTPPTLIWSYTTGKKFYTSSPARGSNNNVYVASDKFYSLSLTNGSLLWSYDGINDVVLSSPVTDFNDSIIFGGQDGKIYALNSDGTKKWDYTKDSGPWSSSPIILENGDVIIGASDGKLYKISNRAADTKPILANSKVTPLSGNSATSFVYYVDYFDADEDPPYLANLFIDNNPPVAMKFLKGKKFNGTYVYEATNLSMGPHTYYFEFTDGNWQNSEMTRLPIVGTFTGPTVNDLPSLSCDVPDIDCVSPLLGDSNTNFTYSVLYVDPDGGANPGPVAWVIIDEDPANPYTMTVASGSVHDGVYTFQITGANLGRGDHTFYYRFTDYLGNVVRYPLSGTLIGPTVNESPVLSNGSVTPTTGDTNTNFKYEVQYSDPDGDPVKSALVYINDNSFTMNLSSTSGGVSTYTYSTLLQKGDNHHYLFFFTDIHDSVGRLPLTSPQTFNGPFVLQSPELSDSTIDPEIGNESTEFTFTIHYEDSDGLPPRIKNLYVNNQPYQMELLSGETYNGTYQAVVNGFDIGVGFDNCYYFEFTNTVDAHTRYPKTGCISGPSIVAAAINIPFWQVRPGLDTLITLNNIGTAPAQTTISLKTMTGVEIIKGPYTIPARGLKTFSLSKETNIINNYGYGDITWSSGSLMAWGVIFNNYNGSAFPIHFDLPRLSPIYLPYYNFDAFKSIDTGIFLTNLSNVVSNGTISFYSSFGQLFSRRALTIQPGTMENIFASTANIPNGVEGYAKVEWDQGVLTIFEAVYNAQEGSGFTVPCYPPFESNVEISNWKRFQGPACALSLTSEPPADFFKLPEIANLNPDIYDASEDASYTMPSLTIDDLSEQELLNPYDVQDLDTQAQNIKKAPAPVFLPVLSNGGVDPIEGSQTRQFMFYVNYFDQDEQAPTIPNLVLDGEPKIMKLASGLPYNGQYTFTQFDMDIDTHRFYFEFFDGNDGDVRYPAFGSFVGPIVADPATFCWDTVFYITNTGSISERADVNMTFNNANGTRNGPPVPIQPDGFPGTYMKIVRLSDYPSILDGIGNGFMSWDGPPLLLFAKVENPVIDKSYTLTFNPPRDETIFIPAWLTYSNAGITTQLYVTNKSNQIITPLLTLFNSYGTISHTESIAPIAPGATGIVDFSKFYGIGLNLGSGYITWDQGKLDIYGHIINQVTNQYYLLNFDRPRIQ